MEESRKFGEILEQLINERGYTYGSLSKLSGVSASNIRNWCTGRVDSPHRWEDILHVAKALRLTRQELQQLLQPTKHPPLKQLYENTSKTQKKFFMSWQHELKSINIQLSPFQAPPSPPYFVGRQKIITEIQTLLKPSNIVVLQGMGGVGKTTIALQIVYKFKDFFPDGVLWAKVDISDAMSILHTFAAALGENVTAYDDLSGRSRIVRDLLGKKKVLIVLDNVENSEQIAPLLPPSNGQCTTLITTRHRNLTIIRGHPHLYISPFNHNGSDSLTVFRKILNDSEEIEQQQQIFSQIAAFVGHLPLAIAICASRLAYSPHLSPVGLLKRLQQQGLHIIHDENQSIQVCFDVTYKALQVEEQRFFASLGVFGSESFSITAVANINDLPIETTEDYLDLLYNLSLIQQSHARRYQLHPLLYQFAQTKLQETQLIQRMIQYYTTYTQDKMHNIDALEVSNIEIALQQALHHNLIHDFISIINNMCVYWTNTGHYSIAETYLKQAADQVYMLKGSLLIIDTLLNLGQIAIYKGEFEHAQHWLQKALTLAYEQQDKTRISYILLGLGTLATKTSHNIKEAEKYLHEGLKLARELKNLSLQAKLLRISGASAANLGNYMQAHIYYEEGLDILEQINGDKEIQSDFLRSMGIAFGNQGKYYQAEECLRQSLNIAYQINHQGMISTILAYVAWILIEQSQFDEALTFAKKGLTLARHLEHSENIVFCLSFLGIIYIELDEFAEAGNCLTEGLHLANGIGHLWLISDLQEKQGRLYLKQNQLNSAMDAFRESFEIACEVSVSEYQGTALFGLAQTMAIKNDLIQAQKYGEQSLAILRAINHAYTPKVEAWFNSLF